jgi:hypothetical protein
MRKFIAIAVEDTPAQVHAASSIAGYLTLCGLDGGLSDDGQEVVDLPPRKRINCPDCLQLWEAARSLRRRDFSTTIMPKVARSRGHQ